jgi:hypothetical protein
MEGCLKKLVLEVRPTGFQDPERGGWESMGLSKQSVCSGAPKWVYTFDSWEAKKFIPAKEFQNPN